MLKRDTLPMLAILAVFVAAFAGGFGATYVVVERPELLPEAPCNVTEMTSVGSYVPGHTLLLVGPKCEAWARENYPFRYGKPPLWVNGKRVFER